ncbi:hypothetical protein CTEN210_13725 [Chaetoceros tenuissimus]|uniref:Leucine-rich repeat domain-containing protein n=1 Tax=Chaetoceros tenuissimus TaxID=426638 RepID=A0AAD3D3V5_9STRA|nr:hypothetical protein CTEN210_13725 [Chaetoceros tenuissimus]
MKVATVEGLLTLYYDGSELWSDELEYSDFSKEDKDEFWKRCWEHYHQERQSWQQIIVIEGVIEIPFSTFEGCYNIQRVIFADTVTTIKYDAFSRCRNLKFIKWSINLHCICSSAFEGCDLSSVFLPPRCKLIGQGAFKGNRNLEILNVPKDVELETGVPELGIVDHTKLLESSPFEDASPVVLDWLKNINNIFPLHRVCSSYEPSLEIILDTTKEIGGEKAFKLENSIGITASQYLQENPYATVTEKEIIEKYVLQIGGIDQEEEMLQLKKREAEKDIQILSLREIITAREHENNALKQEISALKLQLSSENESSDNSIIPMKRSKTNESVASMDTTNKEVADLQSENEDLVQQLKIEKSNHLSTIARLEDARKTLKEAYANQK